MPNTRAIWIGLVLACFTFPLPADDGATIEQLLGREIIGPDLAMSQVQDYTEARVPPMPAVGSVADWERFAEATRRDVLDRVVYRGKAAQWRDADTKVEWLDTIPGGPGYRIKKLRYEALPGLWIPALLYEPEDLTGKVPVILNVNGHDRPNGKAAPYKQMRCINQAKRGMLALNVEWLGMGQLNTPGFDHSRMNQIDLCGTSGLAPFYLSMKRGLDVLLALEHADPERVAVTGLSGGGWQTIIISSLDTRVVLSGPVAGYSSFATRARHLQDLGDSEQTPVDLGAVTDYAQLTALRAPHPTLLTFNAKDDCCFRADHALEPLLAAARPVFELYGKGDRLRSHVNHDPGNHNYERDNREAFYQMLGDFFDAGSGSFDPTEVPSDDELKTKDELYVPVPDDNADFHTLALSLARDLPREPGSPPSNAADEGWQNGRREALAQVVAAKQYNVGPGKLDAEQTDRGIVAYWQLQMGGDWTVPAVEFDAIESNETVILVADEGRASVAPQVENLLAEGNSVLAVDPFYFGESKIRERDYLFALMVSTVGDRPLGIQASQLTAIARWLKKKNEDQPVKVVAVGPRSSLFALVAAALEPRAIDGVELRGSFGSLREVIETDRTVDKEPELFCFGLLEAFDIKPLAALVAPRPVTFVDQANDTAGQ
jgi:dienelactone hydrolase